ncbi:hypothetical protein CVT26_006447 [Gymnopilus dilepis]|uniref:DNA2/NAM7 helicase-like C-terminal domain-containing protein n=1 Tax=Gymnopilus dilepis TaxID=231916 RepID=A0A409Y212_9AGAR|nr:hypothetical protein CVT26_006447 [Gymnopilus dilepis]
MVKPLSATDLAVHQHLECDLYIHNVYHQVQISGPPSGPQNPSGLSAAHFKRGLDWEVVLFSWLDAQNLLLRVPITPLEAGSLLENIRADERNHFFIAGLTFLPPRQYLDERFNAEKRVPIAFGLAKLDLLEIVKVDNRVEWRVIDAKASKSVQPSHHVQLYFYNLCLKYLLRLPPYSALDEAGVWLPGDAFSNASSPSTMDIKVIRLSLLQRTLDAFLFKELPDIVTSPYEEVNWHYNGMCRGCRFESGCRSRAVARGEIGSLPNISIEDYKVLKNLLKISRVHAVSASDGDLTDIEELHFLFQDRPAVESIERIAPTVIKRAKRVLGIPKKPSISKRDLSSPILEASMSKRIQASFCIGIFVIQDRNFEWPYQEDIAVIISVVNDPSSPSTNGDYFGVTVHTRNAKLATLSGFMSSPPDFVSKLADLIRSIESFNRGTQTYSCQFYTWSNREHASLQSTIIQAALSSHSSKSEVRLCIGALSQGASLLQTTFQPHLLSGALLNFLANGRWSMTECRVYLERMGLPTDGTIQVLRKRIHTELERLRGPSGASGAEGHPKQLGQLASVVILKKEIERQLAFPVPGYWDLQECVLLLLDAKLSCPPDEEIFTVYKSAADDDALQRLLVLRNRLIHQVSLAVRSRLTTKDGRSLLVNDAKMLCASFMDVCKQPHIRKLFYMQQFEVLAKLTELWQERMKGCPEAPVLQYHTVIRRSDGLHYFFRLLEGIVETSAADFPLFDKLLVRDTSDREDCSDDIPVEALLDDLALSSVVLPFNDYATGVWLQQHPRVRDHILLADVNKIHPNAEGQYPTVDLRISGTPQQTLELEKGGLYRLSPRLVDFNTAKVLSSLFELDLEWDVKGAPEHDDSVHYGIPFLQLVMAPHSLAELPTSRQYMETGKTLQRLLCDLADFNDPAARSLVLKSSQHEACQHILSNRLSVIWGPPGKFIQILTTMTLILLWPGTGKTHTISSSLVRLIIAGQQHDNTQPKIIFITATTHVAVGACHTMLLKLIHSYQSVLPSMKAYLDRVRVQLVVRGNDHSPPQRSVQSVEIYAGTVYQLYLFSKKHSFEVDCLVVDEAGQVSLGAFALVTRSLSPLARIVITGDSEQLAPILSGRYPTMKTPALFGSLLDCLMRSYSVDGSTSFPSSSQSSVVAGTSRGGMIQLIDNFSRTSRLQTDLGEFLSIIYPQQFVSHKIQSPDLAIALGTLAKDKSIDLFEEFLPIRTFLVELSKAMQGRQADTTLSPPASCHAPLALAGRPLAQRSVSLSSIRLQTWSTEFSNIPYDLHLQAEAAVAATLVLCLRTCCPGDNIFVAAPYRVQREAVKSALKTMTTNNRLEAMFDRLNIATSGVIVETIERLQGSEASFVICLLSAPKSFSGDLGFLLERRRLNVAISRAKTLCILVTSDEILCPSIKNLTSETAAKGYAFLRAYQQRAWSYDFQVQAKNRRTGASTIFNPRHSVVLATHTLLNQQPAKKLIGTGW